LKKKRKAWLVVLVILVLLAGGYFYVAGSGARRADSNYRRESVRRGDLSTYYTFSGNVTVRDSATVAAKAHTTIRELYVRQDDQVRKNDPLVRLSNGDTIRAEIDGEVTLLHVSVGDSVSVGAPMVSIVNFDDLCVIAKIDEYDVSAVSVGKEATMTVAALSETYESRVEHISKEAQTTGDVSFYEAKLQLPHDPRILPGMKVDVRMLAQQAPDALLLPADALRFDAYNNPYVTMQSADGGLEQVPVTVGIQDGTTVQITGGVSEGDTVFVPQSGGNRFMMMPGMRMRN